MQYFIAFLEGVITFLSPCLLPMLPVYLSYFAGGGERSTRKTLAGALGFVAGFTVVFVLMGALAGTAGQLLQQYHTAVNHTAVNIVCGAVVIFFGLCYLGVIQLTLFRGSSRTVDTQMGFGAAVLFGVVFSLGWTPCVGAFLGSALALASQQGHVLVGMAMLLARWGWACRSCSAPCSSTASRRRLTGSSAITGSSTACAASFSSSWAC